MGNLIGTESGAKMSGTNMPTLVIRVVRPQNMQDARNNFLKTFEGQYLPIHYIASVPTNDKGSFTFMMVQQGGRSGNISSNMKPFPSPAGSNIVCNPEFFVSGTSPPQPIPGKVPQGSPMVKVTIEVEIVNSRVTSRVTVIAAPSITSLTLSKPVATWVLDAAGWTTAGITTSEAETLSNEEYYWMPKAKFSLRQNFHDLRDLRTLGPKAPEKASRPSLTHEELGSKTLLRLSLAGPGLGMQQNATGEFAFGGEYVPIAIFTNNFVSQRVMIKRNGRTPVRDAPMSEFGPPDQRVVYHPDFFFPPMLGGNATPRQKPGLIPARSPLVTIDQELTPNTPAVFRFARVKSDTERVQVAQGTAREPNFAIAIESIKFNVSLPSFPNSRFAARR